MNHLRRLSLVAVPALAFSSLAFVPAAPSSAAEPDPTPLANGVDWLSGQLTDGLMHNDQFDFDDLGLTTDTGLAMAYLGETATAGAISAALEPVIADYYTYDVYNADYSEVVGTHVSAGSLAKATAFVEAAGGDPTDFGGHDLVVELEDRVSTAAGTEGRIGDVFFPDEAFEADYSNTLGQAFAANALHADGSELAASSVDFLLAQQCEAGFFRLSFAAADAADQTCDGDAASSASTDVTALALLNLTALGDYSADVDEAKAAAVDWLVEAQDADGSFGSDGDITTPNANSTGLAGWALGDADEADAASAAAVWLRQHQADDFGPCTTGLSGDTGAIAYDDDALAAGRSAGIEVSSQDQFRRATAQAVAAMQWAPAGAGADAGTTAGDYVRAGSKQAVTATGVAPGQTVCFALGASQTLVSADTTGTARGFVTLPSGSGQRLYDIGLTDGVVGAFGFNALAAKTLNVALKKDKVPAKRKQKVTVKGLAVGESVKVKYDGKVVGKGTAGDNHRFTTKFKVGKETGKQKVKVRGEFGNRKAVEKFRVVKAR